MSDDDIVDTLNLIGLGRKIRKILDDEVKEERQRQKQNERPCTFTGGGDADEESDETIW